VKQVFADTLYWGATLHPFDQYRARAIRALALLGEVRLVTTDEVLAELLDGLAHRGPFLRKAAAMAVHRILSDGRADKGYSLVDCVSMVRMRRLRITAALTNDHHFDQEGSIVLLR